MRSEDGVSKLPEGAAGGGRTALAEHETAAGLNFAAAIRVETAVERLRHQRPDLSAGLPHWLWQKVMLAALSSAALLSPSDELQKVFLAALAVPFLSATVIKMYAVALGLRRGPVADITVEKPLFYADVLPRYTILVPLFREPAVAADLVEALKAITYPAQRLQILLILETGDEATAIALALLDFSPAMTVVTVPPGLPQTKPRALNYALQMATGEFVVVYDAEDIPAPDQLMLSASAFARSPGTACLQARLHIHNAGASWLTRQFALEYMALFDWILPALQHARLPVPLGGTSNHFRKDALIEALAWDPFNVTEDADLGIRFARLGLSVDVLPSSTYEEAPTDFGNWLPQRTRWLKGWIQTYAVHTRQPLTLWRDLGPRAFLGFHMLFGGMMLSAIVHPWFYVAAAYGVYSGQLFSVPFDWGGATLWWIGALNLVAGYGAGALLAAVAAVRHGKASLLRSLPLLPAYWLLVSVAAYRALWQLFRDPHRWEKTAHSARRPIN